jgi:hypothetical protein
MRSGFGSRTCLALILMAGGAAAQQPPPPMLKQPVQQKQGLKLKGIDQVPLGHFTTVPPLKGQKPEELPQILEPARLRLRRVDYAFSSEPEGLVFDQTPPAGTTNVALGTPVDVVVSRGPDPATAGPTPGTSLIVTPEAAVTPEVTPVPTTQPTRVRESRPTRRPTPEPATTDRSTEPRPPVPPWLIALVVIAAAAGATWLLRKRPPDGRGHERNLLEGIEIRPIRDEGRQRLGCEPEPQSRITLVVRRDDGTQRVRND